MIGNVNPIKYGVVACYKDTGRVTITGWVIDAEKSDKVSETDKGKEWLEIFQDFDRELEGSVARVEKGACWRVPDRIVRADVETIEEYLKTQGWNGESRVETRTRIPTEYNNSINLDSNSTTSSTINNADININW